MKSARTYEISTPYYETRLYASSEICACLVLLSRVEISVAILPLDCCIDH